MVPRAGNKANPLPLSWYQATWHSGFHTHNPRWSFIHTRVSQTETWIIFLKHCSRFGGWRSEVTGHGTNCFEWVPDNVNTWSLYSVSFQSIWGDRALKHRKSTESNVYSCIECVPTIGADDLSRWDLYGVYYCLEHWQETARKKSGVKKVVQKPMLEKSGFELRCYYLLAVWSWSSQWLLWVTIFSLNGDSSNIYLRTLWGLTELMYGSVRVTTLVIDTRGLLQLSC